MIRTQGDGVENPEVVVETRRKSMRSTSSAEETEKVDKLGKQLLSKKIQSSSSSSSLYSSLSQSQVNVTNYPPEIKPTGKKFYLIPKLISQRNSLPKIPRTPKLIIMEPYKACITPMIPYPLSNNKVRKPLKINKNNLDVNELVRHINLSSKNSCENHASLKDSSQGDDEIAQLKKERDDFERQLRFQMQVNSELKLLLLSAIGDENSTKISNLTEDKMKIAEHLSSNTEKIEFLAGQSEVWRSKFLASSLMVEELAKWKAALSDKNSHLTASNKRLFETIASVREMTVELYSNLTFLSGEFSIQETNLKSSNVLDLSAECLNISQQLVLNSGKIGMPERLSVNLDPLTLAQKQAIVVMENSNDFLKSTDDASKAICNQASHEINQRVRTSSDSFEFVDSREATK